MSEVPRTMPPSFGPVRTLCSHLQQPLTLIPLTLPPHTAHPAPPPLPPQRTQTQALLRHGADPLAVDHQGRSPIGLTTQSRCEALLKAALGFSTIKFKPSKSRY